MQFDVNKQTNKCSRWINTCEYIVLHHTWGSLSFNSQVNYLCNNKAQVSCHYVVGQWWEIAKISDDSKITWHAWVSEWDWKKSLNKYSIWIEIVSDWKTYTNKQRDSVKELINYLRAKYSLSVEKIIRHKDIAPWRKIDVDDSFWNTQYSTFDEYRRSFISKTNLKISKIKRRMLDWLLSMNSNDWNKSNDLFEKQELNILNNAIRRFKNFYK